MWVCAYACVHASVCMCLSACVCFCVVCVCVVYVSVRVYADVEGKGGYVPVGSLLPVLAFELMSLGQSAGAFSH